MVPDSHTVVTYSNDGSAQSGVGNNHFQSMINKEHFPQ